MKISNIQFINTERIGKPPAQKLKTFWLHQLLLFGNNIDIISSDTKILQSINLKLLSLWPNVFY